MWYRPCLVSFMPTSGIERRFSNKSSYWSVFGVRSKLHFLTLWENFRNFLHVCLGVLYFDARRHQYQYQLLTALLRNRIFSVAVTHGLRVNRHVKLLIGALSFISDYTLDLSWITNNTRRWIFFSTLNCISFAHIRLCLTQGTWSLILLSLPS